MKQFFAFAALLALTACTVPVDTAPPPTPLVIDSPTALGATEEPATTPFSSPTPTFTSIPTLTHTVAPAPSSTPTRSVPNAPTPFCDDPRGRELIDSLRLAIASKNGALLSTLVSPAVGMDTRFYRDGNIVNYDVEHAKFVFETAYQADWGLSFGSGEPTIGSFQEIILPSLQIVFTPNAQFACNQIKVGGATYEAVWPYPGMNFYSVHFPGTDAFGGMDWQTWAIGMDIITGKPYLAAFVHFVWEP